jgi:hypothetical protein
MSESLDISANASGLTNNKYASELLLFNTTQPGDNQTVQITFQVGASQGSPLVTGATSDIRVYPNPWRRSNPTSTLHFDSLSPGSSLKIFTLSGHLVKTITADGKGETQWDPTSDNIGSGIYLYLGKNSQGAKTKGKFAVIL